jgi:tRNA dimethylallyltransferase
MSETIFMKPVVFCLMGPTAIGKTDLACELSAHFPIELINVDSSLFYKELNIGAAKPSLEVLSQYPHHLLNICDLNQVYSVAEFCASAKCLCQEIIARQHIPLMVGGSMMYFHAFQQGLAELPDANPIIRAALEQELLDNGALKMHQLLQVFDPQSALRIHPNDTQRLLRAHEIYRISGRAWSEYLNTEMPDKTFEFVNFAMMPEPRSWLHERIALRFKEMISQGFIEEVQMIKETYPDKLNHPALRSVGYRQVLQYLAKVYDLDLCLEKGIVATRQLAKRQMTWIRSMSLQKTFLQPNEKILQEMIAEIQEIMDN